MISPSHGAMIDERVSWWGGASPLGRDFPYCIGRCFRGLDGVLPFGSAFELIRAYPELAKQCLGSDGAYVGWYRDMLRVTGPDGVIYASAYWDHDEPNPISHIRVLGAEGKRAVQVPLPPPGKALLQAF